MKFHVISVWRIRRDSFLPYSAGRCLYGGSAYVVKKFLQRIDTHTIIILLTVSTVMANINDVCPLHNH